MKIPRCAQDDNSLYREDRDPSPDSSDDNLL